MKLIKRIKQWDNSMHEKYYRHLNPYLDRLIVASIVFYGVIWVITRGGLDG